MIPCPRPTCDTKCLDPARPQRSISAFLGRTAATVVAVLAGALLIVGVAAVPGHSRTRRSTWALGHAARWTLHGLGVRVESSGAPRGGPSLVVGNHVSFLDVLALSATAPMRQVAKTEIAGWPLIGALTRRTGTIFCSRNRLRDLPGLIEETTAALRAGHRVQVFPEGTTRCGSSLARFHRAVFQAALDAAVVVTPVTVSYTAAGHPTRQAAFLGTETLLDALRRVLATPGLTVRLRWLPAVPAIAGTGHPATDRRRLTASVEAAVARALDQPVIRPTPPTPPSHPRTPAASRWATAS